MQIYLVGGSVRDGLMGTPSQDRDYVVVGATIDDMLRQGFTQVGADFPVFLHPHTHDEYALARTERKSGTGYHGFLVGTENVTLEEDLARRDLTINALARDERGQIIDPYGGARDLSGKVLRHVSHAFAEDPVRVLRILRFQARFGHEWTVAPETRSLMHSMVAQGELHHLTPERVWKELSRALMEPHPELLLRGLAEFGLWNLPAFRAYQNLPAQATTSLMAAATAAGSLEARFCLAFGNPAYGEDISVCLEAMGPEIPRSVKSAVQAYDYLRLKAPYAVRSWSREETLDMLHKTGGLKDSESFAHAVEAMTYRREPVAEHLRQAQACALAVDTRAITCAMKPGPQVGEAIAQARLQALGAVATCH